MAISLTKAGAQTGLSATDAWGIAAAGDVSAYA